MPSSLGETTGVYIPPQRIRAESATESANGERAGSGLWDKDGFSFGDLLDVINPLQHIPIISNLYRSITGDDIGQVPRVVGGALFGGVIGLVASLLNAIVDEETGRDVGEHAIAMLFGDDEADSLPGETPNTVTVASAYSPINDAIFHDEEAPAPPIPDAPPIMLAAAVTPINDSEIADPAVPAAPPPTPRPDRPSEFARAAATSATARPAAEPVPPGPATAPPIPDATPTNGEAGDEPAEADEEQQARAALLSRFGGGEAASRPGPWISQAMMYGLDRYQAMAQERTRAKPDIDSVF